MDLLFHFVKILEQNGVELKTIDEQIYYAMHLALTHIHIQQLKAELKDLRNDVCFKGKQKESLKQ